jgi:hypothetical protein
VARACGVLAPGLPPPEAVGGWRLQEQEAAGGWRSQEAGSYRRLEVSAAVATEPLWCPSRRCCGVQPRLLEPARPLEAVRGNKIASRSRWSKKLCGVPRPTHRWKGGLPRAGQTVSFVPWRPTADPATTSSISRLLSWPPSAELKKLLLCLANIYSPLTVFQSLHWVLSHLNFSETPWGGVYMYFFWWVLKHSQEVIAHGWNMAD